MKLSHLCLLGVLAVATSVASAQAIWKWRDRDGHLMVSDRPPPADIPEKSILQRPNGPRVMATGDEAAAAPSTPASAGMDKELEARKRKMQQDQAAEKQEKLAQAAAAKERASAQKAENCQRARNQLTMLQSGVRVARPNAQGEREYLDDKGRAAEIARTQQLISANCN